MIMYYGLHMFKSVFCFTVIFDSVPGSLDMVVQLNAKTVHVVPVVQFLVWGGIKVYTQYPFLL